MLKTKVGYSENPDAYASGVETATNATISSTRICVRYWR